MEALENPILYLEELGSAADMAHRHRVPDAAMVYRNRDGSLCAPPGGFTAGELIWRRPREVYLVDVTPHVCELEHVVVFEQASPARALHLTVVWQITDPVAAVAARLTRPIALCRLAVAAWCGEKLAADRMGRAERVDSAEGLFAAVSRRLPHRVDLPGGIRIDLAGLRSVSEAGTDGVSVAQLLSALLGGDPKAMWQKDFELANAALIGLPGGMGWTGDEVLAEEVVALAREALQRHFEIVEHLGKMLPYDGETEL